MIHICTSWHRQGTARTVTPWDTGWAWPRSPPAVGAAPSARPKREALWFTFSQRKKKHTKPTPKTCTHSQRDHFFTKPLRSHLWGWCSLHRTLGNAMGRMNPKGCPPPGPQPSAAGGGAAITSCLQQEKKKQKPKTNHEIGMEKMLHIGGGKKNPTQNP